MYVYMCVSMCMAICVFVCQLTPVTKSVGMLVTAHRGLFITFSVCHLGRFALLGILSARSPAGNYFPVQQEVCPVGPFSNTTPLYQYTPSFSMNNLT